jgi:hypothetical protein
MSTRGIGPGGVFQIAMVVLAAIAIGIDWLVEGHVSKPFLWCVLSIYVAQILAGFHGRLDTIRDNTDEIRKQNEKLGKRMDEIEKK